MRRDEPHIKGMIEDRILRELRWCLRRAALWVAVVAALLLVSSVSAQVHCEQPPEEWVPLRNLEQNIQLAAQVEPELEPLKWDRRAFWITRAADSATTWYALQTGEFSEANPLFGGMDAPEIVAAQFLVTYLIDEYAQHLIANGREREARIVYRTGSIVNGLAAGWNFSQLSR